MIRVAIVDDQPLFTDGLARIVGAQEGMEVVGVAHDGESGVKMCSELRPDVILMDINMPIMDGVTATGKIRDLLPDAKILILTVHADDVHVFQGIKAGATGYLLKDCTPEDLSRAIKTVNAGDTIMAPEIARKMLLAFEEAEKQQEPEIPTLTRREVDIVTAFARGMGNEQIALDLRHPREARLRQVGAVVYAIRKGLVDGRLVRRPLIG